MGRSLVFLVSLLTFSRGTWAAPHRHGSGTHTHTHSVDADAYFDSDSPFDSLPSAIADFLNGDDSSEDPSEYWSGGDDDDDDGNYWQGDLGDFFSGFPGHKEKTPTGGHKSRTKGSKTPTGAPGTPTPPSTPTGGLGGTPGGDSPTVVIPTSIVPTQGAPTNIAPTQEVPSTTVVQAPSSEPIAPTKEAPSTTIAQAPTSEQSPSSAPAVSTSAAVVPTSLPTGVVIITSGDPGLPSGVAVSGKANQATKNTQAQVSASQTSVKDEALAASPTQAAEATYAANPAIGPGGSAFTDSAHFRVYDSQGTDANTTLQMLEGAFDCFITTLGWRSSGLSFNDGDDGAKTKTNIYSVATLDGGAAGVMHSDATTGMAYLEVMGQYLTTPGVTVHEYGHGVHYHQKAWVDQTNTGAWWETFANWFAETYKGHDICAASREKYGQETSASEIDLAKTIGDSYQVIVDGSVDTGNYYQAWPFFTYLTSNPDKIEGLGKDCLHQMQVQYKANSDETPLHVLARVATGASLDYVVGRYWAHMAYVDIGLASAHETFLAQRATLNYKNVDSSGDGYKVKSDRAPQYMGANIIPLKASTGTVSVKLTAPDNHTATLAVFSTSSGTRYVDVKNGAGSVELKDGEEASLVVANTPKAAIMYNGFELTSEVKAGMDYSFTLTGATVA